MTSQLSRLISKNIFERLEEEVGFDTVIEKMDKHDLRNLRIEIAEIIDETAEEYRKDD